MEVTIPSTIMPPPTCTHARIFRKHNASDHYVGGGIKMTV